MKDVCSPASPLRSERQKKFTCYTTESLVQLKNLWNKRHPDAIIRSNDAKDIWEKLRGNLSDVCDKESCWLRQQFARNNLTPELKSYTFAPESPKSWHKNINEWLSSIDIEKVMRQYEQAEPSFCFLGPTPIDFDSIKMYGECVWEELCNFSMRDMLKRSKRKIGIVFNLDEHWKEGSHWTSMFIDVPSRQICYFDSGGDEAPIEVKNFVDRITRQGKELEIDFKFEQNHPFEHQMNDSECGVYCLYFIREMIKNPNFNTFKKKRVTDKEMEKYRRVFFTLFDPKRK